MRSLTGLLAGLAAAAGIPAATAAGPPIPISLSESIVFAGNAPPSGTFSATGLPGCASGTFVDDLKSFDAPFRHIRVERTYSCAGGGGFTALLVLTLEPGADSEAVSGRWVVQGGTGALEGLHGSGTAAGLNAGGAGSGTVDALVHLN